MSSAGEFFNLQKKPKTQSHYNVVQIEVSFVSTRRESDKPEKVNVSILSGCCHLWTLWVHETFWVIRLRRVKTFFLYLFQGVWVFGICVWVSWKLRPRETNKEKIIKFVSILSPKMFYGQAMFIGGNSQKGSRYLFFGFLQMSSNLVSTPLRYEYQSIDDQNHAALTSQSLRATIGPLEDNWPFFHYVIGI